MYSGIGGPGARRGYIVEGLMMQWEGGTRRPQNRLLKIVLQQVYSCHIYKFLSTSDTLKSQGYHYQVVKVKKVRCEELTFLLHGIRATVDRLVFGEG